MDLILFQILFDHFHNTLLLKHEIWAFGRIVSKRNEQNYKYNYSRIYNHCTSLGYSREPGIKKYYMVYRHYTCNGQITLGL